MASKYPARHHDSSIRLSPELSAFVRRIRPNHTKARLCLLFGCNEHTLDKLLAGEGVTKRTAERLTTTIGALMAAAQVESGRATVRMLAVHAEGDAETIGAVLGAALAAVGT